VANMLDDDDDAVGRMRERVASAADWLTGRVFCRLTSQQRTTDGGRRASTDAAAAAAAGRSGGDGP